MPLSEDLYALLGVQAVDTRILRARTALAALDTGANAAAAYNAAKAEADTRRAAANKAQADQRDAELRLQSIETKTEQVKKSLFGGKVTGARELENLQKEVDMLGRQRGDAETQVLEAMDTAAERVAAAEAAEAQVAALAEQYRKIRAVYKQRHAALSEEIAAGEKERLEAIGPVPPALLKRYDGIRAKKSGVGAAPLEADGTCGACHMKLNTTLADAVTALKSAEACDYCQRILVPAAAAADPR